MTKKRVIYILIFNIFLLLLLKTDYRMNDWGNFNTVDDASYLYHSYTIGQDFDLNYTNQIPWSSETINPGFFENSNSFVPKHPIGTGVLSAPFVTIGSFLDLINSRIPFTDIDITYFLYSLSSVFYFIFSCLLLAKVVNGSPGLLKVSNINVFYLFLGSGLGYYAFERFSMSHVYEVFSIIFIFFLSYKNLNKNSEVHNFSIGFLSIFFLTIRWVNIYILLIPIFYYLLIGSSKSLQNLLRSKFYLLGLSFGLLTFLLHTKILYGVYTINPKFIYRANESFGFLEEIGIDSYFSFEMVIFILNTIKVLLFSTEFGLMLFIPVLFFGILSIFVLIFKKKYKLVIILSVIFSGPFGIIVLWQTTASGYGFRYLSALIPISILLIFKIMNKKMINILYFINLFSIYSFLKFETSEATSLRPQINSFGRFHEYSAKGYTSGVYEGLFDIESYLHIIMTSYLAVITFKFLISIFSLENIESLIIDNGYMNDDVSRFLEYVNLFNFSDALLLIGFLFLMSSGMIKDKIHTYS